MAKRNSHHQERMRQTIRRSGAGCHICGQPIDYTLPHLDPRAFVIDHLIPITKGGPDDLSNIAAAHRECNSKKRARDYAPIIRRSGALD